MVNSMMKFLLLLFAGGLFMSCLYSGFFREDDRLLIQGFIDGRSDVLAKYHMVFFLDGQKEFTPELTKDDQWNTKLYDAGTLSHIKEYQLGFCNASFADSKGCASVKTGDFDVSVFLTNEESGYSLSLGKKHIKMGEYKNTILMVQVYLGSNQNKYKQRPTDNFDWISATAIYSDDLKDTIFYYSKKYKRDTVDVYDVKYFKEVP